MEEYEYQNKRVCKYGLQIESCRQCLFEALCRLERIEEIWNAMDNWPKFIS